MVRNQCGIIYGNLEVRKTTNEISGPCLRDIATKLDDAFRNEGAHYVPSFFAAAIIGENPQNFGLPLPPLSRLAEAEQ